MKKKDLQRFTAQLNEEKARLLSHSDDKPEAVSHDDLPDEVDMASSELNQSLTLRLRDRDRHLLQKIEEALTKMEEDTYGTCEDCGETIEVKRLVARPTAKLCIQCKEAQERDEKIYA